MSHRLRLYFGSGRSNTAPELEELEGEDRAMTFHMQPQQPPFRTQYHPGAPDSSLKRSSSMFIPQLTPAEPRPTKSSSMQISLQRSTAGPGEEGPPPGYSQGPAPAYIEPGSLDSLPPPYHSRDVSAGSTEPGLPKRRVFSVTPQNSYNRTANTFTPNGSSPGISFEGFCIRRNSSDGSDAQQVSILPYGSGGLGGQRRWSVQQNSEEGCGGTQRLVFQLQQNQNQCLNTERQDCTSPGAHLGSTGSKGGRVMRYPRIRLEKNSSHQRLPMESPQRSSPAEDLLPREGAPSGEPSQRMQVEGGLKGCTFEFRREPPKRQPHFKIFFSRGAGDHSAQDLCFGNGSDRNSPQVVITRSRNTFCLFVTVLLLCCVTVNKPKKAYF